MAGLNFQTQTIINSNFDPDSNKPLFKAESGHLKVLRDFDFFEKGDKGRVISARSAAGFEPKMCKAVIDFNGIGSTAIAQLLQPSGEELRSYCRLDVYLGVEGAEPFIYSTPWVQKGKPFWIEFTVNKGDDASTIAKNVYDAIVKNHIFLCDKDLVNVSVEGKELTLEGANEYQRFKNIEIVKYETNEDASESVAKMVAQGAPKQTGIQLQERGINGFGTYSQIVKDLRLPTAANWQPYHIRQSETPIIGAIYDQFIIDYAGPASNEGLACVGQKLESTTTHVFWVKHDVADEFSKALTTAFAGKYTPGDNVETVSLDTASTMSENPVVNELN